MHRGVPGSNAASKWRAGFRLARARVVRLATGSPPAGPTASLAAGRPRPVARIRAHGFPGQRPQLAARCLDADHPAQVTSSATPSTSYSPPDPGFQLRSCRLNSYHRGSAEGLARQAQRKSARVRTAKPRCRSQLWPWRGHRQGDAPRTVSPPVTSASARAGARAPRRRPPRGCGPPATP